MEADEQEEMMFVGEEQCDDSLLDAKDGEGDYELPANVADVDGTADVSLAKEVDENGEEKSSGGKEEHKDSDNLLVVDEWDNDDVESDMTDEEEGGEESENAVTAEDVERAILNMPSMKTVMTDIGHLRNNRRIVAFPMSIAEMGHTKLLEVIGSETCEEFRVQFIRPKTNPKEWNGVASFNFHTTKAAQKALENLQTISETLTVKSESNTILAMENFVKEEKAHTHWTDNLVLIRNVPDEATVESFQELFPDAEEIVIHKERERESSKRSKESSSKDKDAATAAGTTATSSPPEKAPVSSSHGFAYLIYPSEDSAKTVVKDFENKVLELNGSRLMVLHYKEPVHQLPRGLMKLSERRLVLRHLDKLNKNVEKAKEDTTIKLPEWTEKRIEVCKALIEKDTKARKEIELQAPTLEEFRAIKGIPSMSPPDAHKTLVHLGVVVEDKRKRRDDDKDRDRNRHRSDSDRSRFRRSSPGSRRSPYRRTNYGSRGARGARRDFNRGMAGMASMMNPLALMMQQNMGLLGAANLQAQGMLNPAMFMQPGMLGATGLVPPGGALPYLGGRDLEPSSKMLRLDEAGNFRADDNRFERSERRFEAPPRREEHFREPPRRRRSRTPDRTRPHRSEERSYGDSVGGASGRRPPPEEAEMTNPVSLLLNLSQMLTQKMEQKRQEVEHNKHGGYERNDYRGGPR